MKNILITIFISIFGITQSDAQKTGMHVINTFHIASSGGWDYIEMGPVNDWLYLSHGTQVNVLNRKTGDSVAVIENTMGVHGIAFDVSTHKGFTSNGRSNSVTVFDMNTNKIITQIPAGQSPDYIFYETFSRKIITCNGRGHNLSIIDPEQNKMTDSVDVGGKPETAVSDGNGRIFVNLEDKNEIVVLEARTFKIMNHWKLTPGEGPTGLDFDRFTKRLFASCDKMLIVVNTTNGKIVDSIKIGDGCDGVVFDQGTKNIFTSNGEGTITVIHEDNPNKFTLVENIETKKAARTIALDRGTHLLYLPTADFEAADPKVKGRPKMKPGTFQVLVVGK